MGLLQYILTNRFAENKLSLLVKAENFLKANKSEFDLLAYYNNLKRLAVFSKKENYYNIIYSAEVNEQSVNASTSSVDFWDGTFKSDSWELFSGENLVPYLQFFTPEERHTVFSVYLKRLQIQNDDYIVLIPFDTESDSKNVNLDKLEDNIISFLKKKSPSEKILTGLNNCKNALLLILTGKEKTLKVFFNQIKQVVSESDICVLESDNLVKIVLFTNDEIDIDLYQIQFLQTIESLSEKEIPLIDFESAGYCSSIQGIKTFLNLDK